MNTSCVKQSDTPRTLHTYWEEPDEKNTDNSTNYYNTPKYAVDVLGGAVSKIYIRLSEGKNRRQAPSSTSQGSAEPVYARIKGTNREFLF